VLNALRYFHLKRYELFAACVMSDHVHLLLQPWPKDEGNDGNSLFWSLSDLMHSVKSFTAHEINKISGSTGGVWEEEFFDRYVRSESDLHEKSHYILRNPWESKLVRPDEDYLWVWTQENEFHSGIAPVPGAGEGVPLSPTLAEGSAFRRDAETNGRDARAPQKDNVLYAKRAGDFHMG
jgi:putative transposase